MSPRRQYRVRDLIELLRYLPEETIPAMHDQGGIYPVKGVELVGVVWEMKDGKRVPTLADSVSAAEDFLAVLLFADESITPE